MPEVRFLTGREDEPIASRFVYEVQFGFTTPPPSDPKELPEFNHPIVGTFSKVTGLREEVERVSWRDGSEPFRVRHGPGTLSGGIVTFEKGVVREPITFMRWITAVRFLSKAMENRLFRNDKSKSDPNDVVAPILVHGMSSASTSPETQIPVGDEFGMFAGVNVIVGACEQSPREQKETFDFAKEFAFGVRRIALIKCWPVAYQISDLDAMASEVAIESLSVSFDEMRLGRALIPERR